MKHLVEAIKSYVEAIKSYANHQPLDLLSPSQIQSDLLAIAGEPHRHRASGVGDSCQLCRRDLRSPVHSGERLDLAEECRQLYDEGPL
jgi:hypothetical protein